MSERPEVVASRTFASVMSRPSRAVVTGFGRAIGPVRAFVRREGCGRVRKRMARPHRGTPDWARPGLASGVAGGMRRLAPACHPNRSACDASIGGSAGRRRSGSTRACRVARGSPRARPGRRRPSPAARGPSPCRVPAPARAGRRTCASPRAGAAECPAARWMDRMTPPGADASPSTGNRGTRAPARRGGVRHAPAACPSRVSAPGPCATDGARRATY